jgi:RHS repeat-associated protein
MTTTNYVWDVAADLPVVLQDGENTYVYGLDLISATDSEGDQVYFLYDGLGSVSDVTDEAGDVVASYSYDVFGAIRSQTGSSDNYWLFTGEQSDADSGMYYLRARYYDPETGRLISRDPIPFINRYSYVGNDPVNRVDPLGLCDLNPFGDFDPLDCVGDSAECVWNQFDCVVNPVGSLIQASVDCILADIVGCTYPMRARFTIALESAAVADALVTGGVPHPKEGGITLITNCGGICDLVGVPFVIGHTIFTSDSSIDAATLAHEIQHVRQYELLGDLFWAIYLPNNAACLKQAIGSGSFQGCIHDRNILEILAGPTS